MGSTGLVRTTPNKLYAFTCSLLLIFADTDLRDLFCEFEQVIHYVGPRSTVGARQIIEIGAHSQPSTSV